MSIDYNKPVSGQVKILDGAVFVWLLSISLWSCYSSIVSKLQEHLVKSDSQASGVLRNKDEVCAHIWAKKYGDDCVSDVQGVISGSRGG